MAFTVLVSLYEQEGVGGDVDPEIRCVQYSAGWVPIGVSARGRDFLCLDLDPSPEGRAGQLILIAVDSVDHKLIAPTFADFLSVYFEQMQRGEIEMDDE